MKSVLLMALLWLSPLFNELLYAQTNLATHVERDLDGDGRIDTIRKDATPTDWILHYKLSSRGKRWKTCYIEYPMHYYTTLKFENDTFITLSIYNEPTKRVYYAWYEKPTRRFRIVAIRQEHFDEKRRGEKSVGNFDLLSQTYSGEWKRYDPESKSLKDIVVSGKIQAPVMYLDSITKKDLQRLSDAEIKLLEAERKGIGKD